MEERINKKAETDKEVKIFLQELEMGREIELKIPLTNQQYDEIFCVINGEKTLDGIKVLSKPVFIKKWDEYYSRYKNREERDVHGEPQVIRIRGEEKEGKIESYFTIKRKSKENGIEFNEENETYIENPDVLRDFFNVACYIRFFEKCKEAWGCNVCVSENPQAEFHLELEKVNQYYYVEIEYTKEDMDPNIVGQLLETLVRKLGLNPKDKDSRSWGKILLG